MGAQDGGDAAIKEPAHAHLLAGGLGLHVYDDAVGIRRLQLLRDMIGGFVGRLNRWTHEELPQQVGDANRYLADAKCAPAASRLLALEVVWTDDARVAVEECADLWLVEGVIAQSQEIHCIQET